MGEKFCSMYPFLEAVRGNWRNALFVACASCPAGGCMGHLVTADAEGRLMVMPAARFRELTGQPVEKEECAGIVECRAFMAAFSLYLEWHTVSDGACALLELDGLAAGKPCGP